MWTHTYRCAHKARVGAGCPTLSLSALFLRQGLTEPGACWVLCVCVCGLCAVTPGYLHSFWELELRASCLCSHPLSCIPRPGVFL